MFDLEQSIANWRQKMLAAGIATPVPLDELEDHLRDLIKRQQRAGLAAPDAFEFATRKIGEARPLEKEFRKVSPFGSSHHRLYNLVLAVYALNIAAFTVGLIIRPLGSGSFTLLGFWGGWLGGYARYLIQAVIMVQDLLGMNMQVWARHRDDQSWLTMLNLIYLAAIAATLFARRFRPKSGVLITELLSWSLLPIWPLGTLIGLYGLWCGELESAVGTPISRLERFIAFVMTPITDENTPLETRRQAASFRRKAGLILGFIAFLILLEGGGAVIAVICRIGNPYGYNNGPYDARELQHFVFPLSQSIVLITGLARTLLGAWLLWSAGKIFRGPQTHLTMAPSHG